MMHLSDRYSGRLVGVGTTTTTQPVLVYRLASRSYKDRQLVTGPPSDGIVVHVQKTQPDPTDNEFIEYPALIATDDFAIVANGTHSVLIRSTLEATGDLTGSIKSVLADMGYEDDGHATPRIAAAISADSMAIGSISMAGLHVERVQPGNGSLVTTSTNGHSTNYHPRTVPLAVDDPRTIAANVLSDGAHHGLAALAYLTISKELALTAIQP